MSRHAVVADAVVGVDDADALLIADGRIAAVTRRDRLGETAVVDLRGSVIVPPFIDSHLHPVGYAALLNGTSLKDATTPGELRDLLAEAASRLPAGQALMAQRLGEEALGHLPTRHDVDRAVGDRPTIAYRYCGHVAVVNTAALELAGIGRDTPDPPGGTVDRDSAGHPTGVLRETAVDLVGPALEPLLPPPPPERVLEAMDGLVATGLTRVGAMAAADQPLWCGVGNELGLLCDLAADLPLDLNVMVIADTPEELDSAARRLAAAGGRVRFWGWKTFADGSLGGHTAALWEPFSDVDTTGTLRLDPVHAEVMARAALDLGGVVAVHAIGDRAVDATLDLFDRLLADGVDPGRLRVEHASVLSDEAIDRFASTGVIASIQPAFLTSEAGWAPTRLGPGRDPYRFASMQKAGVRMVGGSDCPVERPDPLVGIAAAVERRGWDDGENLPRDDALSLFTSAPGEHFGHLGLVPGGPADFVTVGGVLGSPQCRVEAVFVGGESLPLRPVPWPG